MRVYERAFVGKEALVLRIPCGHAVGGGLLRPRVDEIFSQILIALTIPYTRRACSGILSLSELSLRVQATVCRLRELCVSWLLPRVVFALRAFPTTESTQSAGVRAISALSSLGSDAIRVIMRGSQGMTNVNVLVAFFQIRLFFSVVSCL